MRLFDLFLTQDYFILVYISVIFAFVIVLLKLYRKNWMDNKLLKNIYLAIFFPVAAIPFIKCHFKVPFIFCRACPRRCAFGELRPFLIPSVLLLNLDRRSWCYRLCPPGTLQDYQAKVCRKRLKLPGWLIYVSYLFLSFTVILVLLVLFNERFKNPFFIGRYQFVVVTFAAASIIFLLSFFIPRFWCNYICPVGCAGDLALKVVKKTGSK
ncbi:4Fe-4S binding protein [Candidatus Woesearchaeota archaeon]|nr:4Fe-4S binding protein [Candidatus Woesearchaeota archaeon]